MSSLLTSFFHAGDGDVAPAMSWRETEHCHVFELDLPGLSKDDVKVNLHRDTRTLHVAGERRDGDEFYKDCKGGDTWHLLERPRRFSREVALPENARADDVTAAMRDGVLVVTVAKGEEKGRKGRREVEISGGEEEKGGSPRKGLGRFVCCRA